MGLVASLPEPKLTAIPAGKNVPRDTARTAEFSVEVVRSLAELAPHGAAWEDLCQESLETNPWCEPWFVEAGLKHLDHHNPLRVLLVHRRPRKPTDSPLLCGVFPFEEYRPFPRLPLRALRLWKNEFVCLGTPPVRREFASQTLNCVFDWALSARHGALYLDLPHLDAGGPFQQTLVDVLYERQIPSFTPYSYNRAFLTPAATAEDYLEQAMTCHHRQELRRQRRRLAEQGVVAMRALEPCEPLDPWLDQFFELEARGWKGQEGGALAMAKGTREFFTTLARELHDRGRLMLLGLFVDDRPIAFKFNLLAGDGAFAFKICFDEAFAKFSPGVQLEIENIEQVHARGLRWMDSCAVPGHFMISRLWSERRTIHRVLVPVTRSGAAVLSLFPLLRGLRYALRRKK